MLTFNSVLLKLLRESNGLTQEAFCRKFQFNQALLSQWERGIVTPSAEMISKLASALLYPADFFMSPMLDIPTGLAFHRKRSSLHVGLRTQIEARARLLAFDAIRICQYCNVTSNIPQRNGMSPDVAAKDLRKAWHIGKGPLDNLVATMEEKGIIVLAFDFGTDLLDGFFLPARTQPEYICIALNTNEVFAPDRQRFTLAHELGHALLHRDEFPEMKVAEDEANEFASEFLLPAADVKKDLAVPLTFSNLKRLKMKWGVSMGALTRRARDVEAATAATYRRTCVFLSSCGYRKHEPDFGLEQETPTLVNKLMCNLLEQGVNIDDILLLSPRRLEKRYPKVFKGGMRMTG